MFDIEIKRSGSPIAQLILGHGAGAGKEHEFMQTMSALFVERNIDVVLFNFPYMQTIKETGKRRPPDKAEKLLQHFHDVVAHIETSCVETSTLKQTDAENKQASLPIFIGGKSMGGRMATMSIEDMPSVKGAVAFGYPFHPPGKPEKTRTDHLQAVNKPLLIVQGERDTFGTKSEVAEYALCPSIEISFLADGDHSFKPRKTSGFTQEAHIKAAVDKACDFIIKTVKGHVDD
ncbi:MAG: alpha/beta family hydrolase [Alteromonas sp.]|jgi:predicted alpha/beta-hydrolase family hydrolase|uniref:alpha/beta family hydrolase n=1 Tax=Alteromonas sp. TaxID=232 RepID=UPI0032D973D0